MRTKLFTGVAAVVLAVTLGACSSGSTETPKTDNGASGTGRLTIGIASDEPGVSLRTDDGYVGFDIDTAEYVAGKLGVPSANITWQEVDPGQRLSVLENGSVDMVVATFSMTDERAEKVDFAGPYFIAHQDMLIRRNDEELTGPEKLDGRTVCEASGTTSGDFIKENYRGRITVREVPTFSECVRSLASGDVDAVSTDDLLLAGFAAQPQYKGVLKVLGKPFPHEERYGIGLPKGDDDMVEKVNAALQDYIDSGAWEDSLNRHVAPSGYAIPSPPKVGS